MRTVAPRSYVAQVALCMLLWASCHSDIALPERIDYNFHVKPILSDRCYACHGLDANARQADLRLDTEEGALHTPISTRAGAIVPGSRRKSTLWRRISSRDTDYKMPPPESTLSLSGYEMAVLARWIKEGATWKPHCSFLPPEKAPLPAVDGSTWPRNAIDHFVLALLRREGLAPSPEAPKEALIRRVTLDLTGLAPFPLGPGYVPG